MAGHTRRQGRRKPTHQDSPFLRLPYDVRLLIYYAALVRPTSIDLWPRTYFSNPEKEPSLATRFAKAQANCLSTDYRGPYPIVFRRQDDLQYVRTEMATGLLATCSQIYHEAANLYWHTNTFRFSSDTDWHGVRRFLGSIGPRAISQLRTLEVFAPVVESGCLVTSGLDDMDVDSRTDLFANCRNAKNVPKMHMVKAGKDPWRGIFWYSNGVLMLTGATFPLTRNVDHVCYLLRQANATLELNFVLPEGWGLNLPKIRRQRVNGCTRILTKEVLYLPEVLLQDGERFASKMTLVVEAGAYMNSVELPADFTSRGINVLCEIGSFLRQRANLPPPNPIFFEAVELTAPRSWVDPSSEFDYLIGVSSLLDDKFSERILVPACGGKANKNSGPKKMERVLRGFGGCRFVWRPGWDCEECNKTGVYLDEDEGKYRNPYCQSCDRGTGRKFRDVVELKRMVRAVKRGEVSGDMVLLGTRASP